MDDALDLAYYGRVDKDPGVVLLEGSVIVICHLESDGVLAVFILEPMSLTINDV